MELLYTGYHRYGGYGYVWDPTYFLVIIGLLLTLGASLLVKAPANSSASNCVWDAGTEMIFTIYLSSVPQRMAGQQATPSCTLIGSPMTKLSSNGETNRGSDT